MAVSPLPTERPQLTIRRLLEDLSPGQLWTAITAAATLLGLTYALGQRYSVQAEAVPCYQAEDWPAGSWLTWGHISHAGELAGRPFPQITPSVTFESSGGGTAITDEHKDDGGSSVYRFTATPPVKRSTPIQLTGRDVTGYTSTSHVVVSADGCMMKGNFEDSHGNTGSVNYLFERNEYFIRN